MYQDKNEKIIATIEARMTSTRLPGKVLMPLAGIPALERLIERLKCSRYLDEIVIATTINSSDDVIVDMAKKLGVKYFRGSEKDVLGRVLGAAQSVDGNIIVEITGDCPLVDPKLVDRGVEEFFYSGADYASNIIKLSYPIGFDVQVFSIQILDQVSRLTVDPIDRAHVSYYIYSHPEKFKLHNWSAPAEDTWPKLRLTLDEKEDYELLDIIFKKLLPQDENFTYKEVINLLRWEPQLLEINKNIRQKEIYEG